MKESKDMGSEAIDPCHILVAFLAVKIREGWYHLGSPFSGVKIDENRVPPIFCS